MTGLEGRQGLVSRDPDQNLWFEETQDGSVEENTECGKNRPSMGK